MFWHGAGSNKAIIENACWLNALMKNIADIVAAQPRRRRWWPLWSLVALAALTLIAFYSPQSVPSVNASARIAEVTRGDLQVQVFGYGRLQSKHQRLLTAEARAVVEQVLLKPGATVTPDSVILVLSAPELLERLAEAELEHARIKADYDAQLLQDKDELLAFESQIAQMRSDFELAKLRVEAESALVQNGIVSTLDFQRSKLSVRQLETRLEIARKRRDTLLEMGSKRQEIQAQLLSRYADRLASLKQRVSRLQVRAGLTGVLQALAVEIGQSVPQGSELATVGSTSQLIAELRVAQDQADRILPGHEASVLVQGQHLNARVLRVDPVVTDGRVLVEVDVLADLPVNARPDLTVEGRIDVAFLQNVLLLEAPMDSAAFATRRLFKLTQDHEFAEATELKFGNLSGGQLEVLGGAGEGDRVIISDTSQWLNAARVELTQ